MIKDYIRHQGWVERIEKQKVYVRIEQKAACSDCHARSACLAADKKDRIIEVDDASGLYEPCDEVIVSTHTSMGFLAIFIAFVIPLVLVVATFAAGMFLFDSEGVAGLTGLATLVPYYFAVYLFRNKLRQKLRFTLSKPNLNQ
jgi:sigma-E factor negative regulatory protein RseC